MSVKKYENVTNYQRLGFIRLGVKQDGRPRAVDYFVCPKEVEDIVGEQPKELDVTFFSEDIDDVLSYFYKRFANGKLLCVSDGNEARQLQKQEKGKYEWVDVTCDIDSCEHYKKNNCSLSIELRFLLPHVNPSGYYQINTKSIQTLINLKSTLELIKKTTGDISWKPMKLVTKLEKTKSGVAPRLHLKYENRKQKSEVKENNTLNEAILKQWHEICSAAECDDRYRNALLIDLYNKTNISQIESLESMTDEEKQNFMDNINQNKDKAIAWVKKQQSTKSTQ